MPAEMKDVFCACSFIFCVSLMVIKLHYVCFVDHYGEYVFFKICIFLLFLI